MKRIQDLTNDPSVEAATSAYAIREVCLPVELLPWLLLSDEKNARNVAKLKALGVTHVLSVNGTTAYEENIMQESLESVGIVHRRIAGDDQEGYDMIGNHWDDCRAFIEDAREGNEVAKVLVHCVAGINRSGLISCAAHMCFERETVLKVVEHCMRRRGAVLWNRSFQKQLCLLAAEEGLLGAKPAGYSDEPSVPIHVGPAQPPARDALSKLF
jgi:protein-tyrosine phosphatase